MGAREDRRARRRALLLDAAMSILAEGGLEALTIPALAERMDASVGGLYRYFPSKEAIFVALQERAIDAFAEFQQAEVWRRAAGSCSPTAHALIRVAASFHAYLEHAERDPAHHALLDAFISAPAPTLTDDQARAIDRHLEPVLGECARHLEHAVEVGALGAGDALSRTHVLWAAVHGLDHFRKRDRIQPPALRVASLERTLLRAAFIGWGGAPETVDEALTLLADT